MKLCRICSTEKDSSEFHKRAASKDGLAARCKSCQSDYDKKRANLPHRVKQRAEYQKTDAYKESHKKANRKYTKEKGYERTKKYRESNQKKHKVHGVVAYAIKCELLIKKPCEVCGCDKVHAHHCDYDRPLDVMWLCPEHHIQWHKENGEGANAH